MVQIRIEIVSTIDQTAGIESKKSIKSRFKFNLERISAQGRSNRISLLSSGAMCSSLNTDLRVLNIFSTS